MAGFALAVGLYIAASTIRTIVKCWYSLPYDDQWAQLVSGRSIDWAWLVSQHNEHRILFPRLIFLLDYWWAGERNIIDFVANILVQTGFSLLLIRIASEAPAWRRSHLVWASGVVLAFLFWTVQWDNFIWGFQVQFLGEMLAATATFAMLALGRPATGSLAAVICLEIVSVYTLSSGITVPFLTVVLAIWLGRSRGHIALLTLAAVLLAAAYLDGYQTPSSHSGPFDAAANLGKIFKYMATELGGPIAEALHWRFPTDNIAVAAFAGAVGIATFAGIAASRLRNATNAEAVLLMLGCFLVSMAFLTGIGRAAMGLDQALAVRYATPAGLFWLAIILLVAMRHPAAGMILALPALGLIAYSQRHFAGDALAVASGRAMAEPAMLAGVDDDFTLKNIHTNAHFVLGERALLKAAHRSVFADAWANWAGTPLSAHVAIGGAANCRGSFEMAWPLSDQAHPGWRGVGQLRPLHGPQTRDRIILSDKDGIVVGYGLGGFNARQVGTAASVDGRDSAWWVAAFTGETAGQTTAYVLLDQATACPLGSAPSAALPASMKVTSSHPADLPAGGFMTAEESSRKYRVEGWGMLRPGQDTFRVMIDTNLPVASAAFSRTHRPDVVAVLNDPALVDSGFDITLDLDEAAPRPQTVRLCVWTDDLVYGRRLVHYATQPDLCPS